MSDEINERETGDSLKQHELSETPLGGYRQEDTPAEPETKEEAAAAEPEPTAPAEKAAVKQEREETAGQVDYSHTFRSLAEGEVVGGVVVHIDKEGVLVDVGTKSEGLIRPHELSREANLSPEDVVQVGERIDVYVMQSENEEGNIMLSKKRADFEMAWEKVEQAHKERKTINAMVTDRVKGGLVVDLGIRGFVPASHVGSGNIKNLDKYVGQSIPLKVIEVDRERRKVVLSHRLASEQEREQRKAEIVGQLAEGQVRDGVVRRLTDYGAFIDLGGIDGLLHISEMSWTRIKHPSDMLRVGQKLQVLILKLNMEQERISLGLRQILPDPWSEVERNYRVGDVIRGTVTRLVPFGAFVQVDGGIEGIIPNNELARRRVNKPEEVVSTGQEVEVKILDLRPEERRMTLSLRALQAAVEREREQKEMDDYTARPEARTTIGDLVGAAFARQQEDQQPVEEPPTEAEPEAKPKRRARGKRKAEPEAEGLPEAQGVEETPAAEAAVEEASAEVETNPTAEQVDELAASPAEEKADEEAAPAEDVVGLAEEPVAPEAEMRTETGETAEAREIEETQETVEEEKRAE